MVPGVEEVKKLEIVTRQCVVCENSFPTRSHRVENRTCGSKCRSAFRRKKYWEGTGYRRMALLNARRYRSSSHGQAMRRAADQRRRLEGRLRWYQRRIMDLPKALRELNRLWWRCRDRVNRGEPNDLVRKVCVEVDEQYREYRKVEKFNAAQLNDIMIWVKRVEGRISRILQEAEAS
jgi:hypothetical protein